MKIPPDLLSSTQNATVDRILQGVIALLELTLPSHVRSYYLEGSYAEGTATAASDIDLYVILKEPLSAEETRVFWAVARSCHLLSSIPLDVFPLVEQEVLQTGSLGLKYASQVLFGEDIRASVPDSSPEVHLHRAMHTPFEFMKRLRGASFLVYPLDYPDPASEFFGYEISRGFPAHNAHRNSLKELMAIVCFTAASIVGYRSGRFVITKSQALQLYEREVGDGWSALIKSAFAIRDRWRYQLPKEAVERDELRAICQSTLHFENHFLELYRGFLLDELLNEGFRDNVRLIERAAQMIYPDSEFLEAFKPFRAAKEEKVRRIAEVAVARTEDAIQRSTT